MTPLMSEAATTLNSFCSAFDINIGWRLSLHRISFILLILIVFDKLLSDLFHAPYNFELTKHSV